MQETTGIGPKEKQHDLHPSPRRRPWNIRSLSSPGTTSGLGHAAARLLAIEGYRQVIINGRSLARVQETVAQLAAETTARVFTPLELDLDSPSSVQSALAELVKRGQLIDFLVLNAGWIGVRSACSLRLASRRLRPR